MARFITSKSARLPTLIEPRVMPRPVSNRGSSPVPDGDRLAPIRLTCPPTAKAFSDIAIGAPDLARASSDKVTIESIDGHIAHAGGAGIDIETGYSDIELRDVRLNCNEPNRRAANAYGLHANGSFDTLTMSGVYLQDCGYGLAFTPSDQQPWRSSMSGSPANRRWAPANIDSA